MNYLADLPETTIYHDLFEVCAERGVICPDFSFDPSKYQDEEIQLALPALESAGYITQGKWFDGERDSFGPLTRCIHATDPDGHEVVVVYG